METPDTAKQSYSISVGIIIAGIVLSAAAAIVPQYSYHKLMFGVLLAGLLPYVIFGFAAAFLTATLSIAAGLILLVIHAGVVVNERFMGNINYNDGLVYYVPLILTALLIPLLIVAARKPWHR
ncbi:MAG: hypothetical protein PVJ39_04945 [Gammaproteobacteria bacterium]|jgi:hypothetical protein